MSTKNIEMNRRKIEINDYIQSPELYGIRKEADLVKHYISSEALNNAKNGIPISGESSVMKSSFGGVIITRRSIGEKICELFNNEKIELIKNKSQAHISLCERKDEASALLFITLNDLEPNFESFLTNGQERLLCQIINNNLRDIVEHRLQWLINYSKHVIRDYYSLVPNRIRIKPNYLLDDGVYPDPSDTRYSAEKSGGLLINGLLDLLKYYTETSSFHEDIGIICQVLSPTGLPKNKKWTQIDVGVSFVGKRLYKESIIDALLRQVNYEIHCSLSNEVLQESVSDTESVMGYGTKSILNSYEGTAVYPLEVWYSDQISYKKYHLNWKDFCKCADRYKSIEYHKRPY